MSFSRSGRLFLHTGQEVPLARFGRNMKLTTGEKHRAVIGAVLGEVLGGEKSQPLPAMDIYRLPDGFSIGVSVVPDEEALSDAALRKAPWLEFEVADVEATRAALGRLGIQPFDYVDRSHLYFQVPGGPAFRLASAK